jgi:hypothetical protein
MGTFPVPGIPNLTMTTLCELPDGSSTVRLETDTDMRISIQNVVAEETKVLMVKAGRPTTANVPAGGRVILLPLVKGPQKFRQ